MDRGVGMATFAFGLLSGVLLAFVAEELWPSGLEEDLAQYREVRDFARESFVRDIDDEELVKLALSGMLRGLDEYSRYYDVEQSQTLERETRGRFRGIGAIFRQPVGAGRVLYPLAGSPAARGGLRVGDQFLTLEGTPLGDLDEAEFRALLSDPPGGTLEAPGDSHPSRMSPYPHHLLLGRHPSGPRAHGNRPRPDLGHRARQGPVLG